MMEMWSEKPRLGRGTALYASHLLVYTWSSVLFPLVAKETCWWKRGRMSVSLAWLKSLATMKKASGCLFWSSQM